MFELIEHHDCSKVISYTDRRTKLRVFIAIYSTFLRPALGGCRMKSYSSDEEALTDALKLAKAVTLKLAAAGLDYGGAKAVIIGNPDSEKTTALLKSFGLFVHSLAGEYITAEDSGISADDITVIRSVTPYVLGASNKDGGLGDPSQATAYGVLCGIKAALKIVFGSDKLQGRTVALQGVGNVGSCLANILKKEGANLIITDIDQTRLNESAKALGVMSISPERIYDMDCDVFSPCALGGTINKNTIPRLRCKIIAGPANNQLLEQSDAEVCASRGIFFVPDFIISSGGAIFGVCELEKQSREKALSLIENTYGNVIQVAEKAKKQKISANQAAYFIAKERASSMINKKENI